MSETNGMAAVQESAQRVEVEMTLEDRMLRVDTLLCILFAGLVSHPLATTLIPPAELAQLRAILPQGK